jgi:hypothetical protein
MNQRLRRTQQHAEIVLRLVQRRELSIMPFRLGVPPEIVLVTLGGGKPVTS